jgi:hypothetical protein
MCVCALAIFDQIKSHPLRYLQRTQETDQAKTDLGNQEQSYATRVIIPLRITGCFYPRIPADMNYFSKISRL